MLVIGKHIIVAASLQRDSLWYKLFLLLTNLDCHMPMQIDCDKAVMVTLKHDDKLQDGAECAFQVYFAFMYLAKKCWYFVPFKMMLFYVCSVSFLVRPSVYYNIWRKKN
jgi:hypothetical protein